MALLGPFLDPTPWAARGLLGAAQEYGPEILDYFKNRTWGPEYDSMYGLTSSQPTSRPAASPYPQGTDPMTAGSPYPQGTDPMTAGSNLSSAPTSFTAPQAAPLSQGLLNPIAVGRDYQMPRLGDPSAFVPQTPTDISAQGRTPNAQSAQGQPDFQLPPALRGNSGDSNFMAGLKTFANTGALFPSILAGITGQRGDPQGIAQDNLNALYNSLRREFEQNGLSPQQAASRAAIAVLNPKAGESIFKGEYENPKTIENVIANRMAGGKGNATDAMNTWLQYKQNLAQAEKSGSTTGEKQAEVAATLPDTLSRTAEAIKQISEVRNHSAKDWRTGFPALVPAIPGLQSKGVDFDERVAQLRSSNFLAAAQQMRSLGALSNAEGAKIEGIQARLKQTKGTADFDQALSDMEAILKNGYLNLQKMAGQNAVPYQMPIGESRMVGDGVTIRRLK